MNDPTNGETRLAVFLSGTGRTLVNLLESIESGRLDAAVVCVVASRECRGAAVARERGIRTQIITGEISEAKLDGLLASAGAQWVVLAGYLKRLPIPETYRGRVVNIHPALLPDFGGHGMYGDRVHQAVLAAGVSRSGCTVHLCDEDYDTGPIVMQRECPVLPGDTPETLASRVFELECRVYPEALSVLLQGAQPGVGASGRR